LAVGGCLRYGRGIALSAAVWVLAMPAISNQAIDDFQMACAACHTIGGGRLVGPDLVGVGERRSRQWLHQFIKSSQALISSGDPDAVAIYNEYNNMIMPDTVWSDAQISAVVTYIADVSAAASNSAAAFMKEEDDSELPLKPAAQTDAVRPSAEDVNALPETVADVDLGRALFQGTTRLSAGGVACNACHDINGEGVLGGGSLARGLTSTYSTMGDAGIHAVIQQPPFPVMRAAYEGRPLADHEVSALTAFLKHVDANNDPRRARDYGAVMLSSGVVGSLALFGLCGFVWRGRRKGSVNQDIYDRQDRTS